MRRGGNTALRHGRRHDAPCAPFPRCARPTAYAAAVVLLACAVLAFVAVLPVQALSSSSTDMTYWSYGHLVYDESDSRWYSQPEDGAVRGSALFQQVDGRAYRVVGGSADRSADGRLFARFYPDGELVFQMGDWEEPYKLSNGCHCLMTGEGATWFRESAQTMELFSGKVVKVRFDSSIASAAGAAALGSNLSGLLSGLSACERVEGLQNLSNLHVTRAANLFKGCASLVELDLSGLDTSACTDMGGMLDGCTSLEKLVLGSGWTQAAVDASTGAKALFPADMASTYAGQRTVHKAGQVVPSGFGTYTTTRASIGAARVVLLDPEVFAVRADQLAQQGWSGITLPEGVGVSDVVVFSDAAELSALEKRSFEYTGSAVEPRAVVELDGTVLRYGSDYAVSYAGNVEDGTATATVRGTGAYSGSVTADFTITDTGAYAFLYENGTLVLQAGHRPAGGMAGANAGSPERLRWDGAQDGGIAWQDVPWSSMRDRVTRVCVDESFLGFSPGSTRGWFAGCTGLSEMSGLEHVDMSECEDAGLMFAGCPALASLDLSAWKTPKMKTASQFLAGCGGLQVLTFGAGWRNAADQAGAAFPAEAFAQTDSYRRHAAGECVPDGAGTYLLGGIPLQLAQVVMDKPSFECTGEAIEPAIELTVGQTPLVEGRDYTVAYSGNVLPGKATATISGRGAFSGGLVIPFTIRNAVSNVGDRIVYRTNDVDYTFEVLAVRIVDGVPVAASLRLLSVNVKKKAVKQIALPSACTVGGASVDVTAVSSKLGGNFRNVSCVIIGAKVTVIGAKAFAKAKKVTKLKLKTTRLKKATNSLKGSKVKTVAAVCKLTKAKRKSYKKMFEVKGGRKNVSFKYAA